MATDVGTVTYGEYDHFSFVTTHKPCGCTFKTTYNHEDCDRGMCDNDCGLERDDEEEYVKHEEFFCSTHKQQVDKIIERLAQIDAKKIELDMESHGLYAELVNLRKCFVRHIHD